jgi:hypothetical protein
MLKGMTPRLSGLLMACATIALAGLLAAPALAQGTSLSGNNTPPGGWTSNVPPTGWGGIPSANTRGMNNGGGDHGGHGDHGHGGHFFPGPVYLGIPYDSYGSAAPAPQPIIINMPPQPAPEPTGPPPPVPGIDTHPTVEQTPSGVEIIRGPGSS